MTASDRINVAVVGLGFGEDFLPVYAAHPHVGALAIVDTSEERLRRVGEQHGIEARYTSFEAMLADPRWDAVHVVAPVKYHADFSIATLRAGKHCACAVPMGLELDELGAIVAAQRETGKNYMMMETSVYGREFLATQEMHKSGHLGVLTLYRGFHVQNLDGYPSYWQGYPPMKYLTHALSPVLALTGTTVADVVAYGSGRLTPDREGPYGNPFPAEIGLFRLRESDVVAEITMSFFQLARTYIEGFALYGDAMSVEWPDDIDGPLHVFELLPLDPNQPDSGLRGRRAARRDVQPRDFPERLPESLVPYLRPYMLYPRDGGPATRRLAEHSGSHPHLVHEFISSIVEERAPAVDAVVSAAWTAPGICAHESALHGGERVAIPRY